MIRLHRVMLAVLIACFAASGQSETLAARLDRASAEIDKVVQIFIRNGQLFLADGRSEATVLKQCGPDLFGPVSPDFNQERYRFDSIVEGHALRMFASGMPMYRSAAN